jgi:mannose-6-phosphate isomerase-like protein (cupin superfamily)
MRRISQVDRQHAVESRRPITEVDARHHGIRLPRILTIHYVRAMSHTGPVRRIVTGHNASNQSIIVADGPSARIFDNLGQEGLIFQEIWATTQTPAPIDRDQREVDEDSLVLAPPTNGVRIRVLDIPPDTEDESLDEVFENISASDEQVESDRHPSFHRTESIDFGIVLSGEIVLLMDEGETTVGPGEIVVQRGTNHGWANRTDQPCRVAFVLIDGVFTDGLG